jgi:starch synthase
MKVTLTTCGRFHTFALARELLRHQVLDRVFTGFPWFAVKREQLPRCYVKTFPWYQTPRFALERWHLCPPWLGRELGYAVHPALDRYAARNLGKPDIYMALSGSGLMSGLRAQSLGAKYICDRGSSHILYQERILKEEYRRLGTDMPPFDQQMIRRELGEYEQADAITVPSEFVRRSFLAEGVAPQKLWKIPYGCNIDAFQPVGGPPKETFEVLFIGALSLRKGVPYLLQAFKKFRHPHKHLNLVGSQTEDWPFIASHTLDDNVKLLGTVPNLELKNVMGRAHVMVLPSIEEGLALVMGEALACGCPVIASENTGAGDLFTDGVEGFIVPIRDPDAIADRLQRLADCPDLRMQMSQAAHERALKLGGWRQYGDHMLALYQSLL